MRYDLISWLLREGHMIILKLNELNFPSVRKLSKLLHILLVRIQMPRRTFQLLVKLAHITTVKSFGAWIWCLRNKIRSDFPSCPRCILRHTDHLALTCMTNDPCSISDAKIIWPDIYASFFLSRRKQARDDFPYPATCPFDWLSFYVLRITVTHAMSAGKYLVRGSWQVVITWTAGE
jgi:hypothetical protein